MTTGAPEIAHGFGGATLGVADALDGPAKAVRVFGVNRELARRFGERNGGAAVFVREHSARMAPWTAEQLPSIRDVGVLDAAPEETIDSVIQLASSFVANDLRPLVVGCDHTVSYAHALGVSTSGDTAYVYFDAHLDLGYHDDDHRLHNGSFVDALRRSRRFSSITNIGARSWSSHGEQYRDLRGIDVLRFESVDAIEHDLATLAGRDVYVSIDADVVDPIYLPNVCCPEPFGMTPTDLLRLCRWLAGNCNVRGADVSELIPAAGAERSAATVMRCALELFMPR